MAVSLFAAQSSSAATFDFVSMSDNALDANYIGDVELNWADAFPTGLTIDGVTLNASGSHVYSSFSDAFLDKNFAGLGVCSTTHATAGSSGCASGIGSNTWDDNIQLGETLTLDFGQAVDITSLFFVGAHVPLNGFVNINGGDVTVVNGFVTSGFSQFTGLSVFDFTYSGSQFYLASATVAPVPLPAAGLLLFGALGGLAAIARRRRRA